MIQVEGLTKYYSGSRAIEDVSFSIEKGQIVGLLGLNGAGKSTILKILGCFSLPTAGTARVAGHSVEEEPHAIRKLIGYLPDRPPLYDEMTVRQYLKFVARLKDVPSAKLAGAVDQALGKTNTAEVADVPLGSLSHGFRQRVGIAQALVHEPEVLILDEPINGLDPVQIVDMRDMILSLRGQHTVILSSHILSEITYTCDQMVIIHDGRFVAQGSESDLAKNMSDDYQLVCEVESTHDSLVASLTAIDGVKAARVSKGLGGGHVIELDVSGDPRAQVAKTIVEAGSGLRAMSSQGAGLEGLFMQFVSH